MPENLNEEQDEDLTKTPQATTTGPVNNEPVTKELLSKIVLKNATTVEKSSQLTKQIATKQGVTLKPLQSGIIKNKMGNTIGKKMKHVPLEPANRQRGTTGRSLE